MVIMFNLMIFYKNFSSWLLWVSQAAKETGALQAAKSMLEKQVEELTWRLQLEKRMRVYSINFIVEILSSFFLIVFFTEFVTFV